MTNHLDHAVSLASLRQVPHLRPLCQVRREAKKLGKEQDQAVNQTAADLVGC